MSPTEYIRVNLDLWQVEYTGGWRLGDGHVVNADNVTCVRTAEGWIALEEDEETHAISCEDLSARQALAAVGIIPLPLPSLASEPACPAVAAALRSAHAPCPPAPRHAGAEGEGA